MWRDVLGNVDRVRLLVSERDAYKAEGELLERFVRKLLVPVMNKLQWDPQPNECMFYLRVSLSFLQEVYETLLNSIF